MLLMLSLASYCKQSRTNESEKGECLVQIVHAEQTLLEKPTGDVAADVGRMTLLRLRMMMDVIPSSS